MKKFILLSLLLFFVLPSAYPQGGPGYYGTTYTRTPEGDSILTIYLWTVYVYPNKKNPKARERAAARSHVKYNKLIYNVRKVYPIALDAKAMLAEVESRLQSIPNERAQKAYINNVEKELKDKYTPILKEMTFTQGKILIKLIDRETDRTSYELVRELKSGFSAFMWQNLARLFGANLKQTYDAEGDDREIEEIIRLYEMGLI